MRLSLKLLLVALTACGPVDPDDTDTDTDTDTEVADDRSMVGAWQTRGDADGIGWLAGLDDGGTARIDHLAFEAGDAEAGIVAIHVRDASGQLACETATWTQVRPGAILVSIEGRRRLGARLLLWEWLDPDTVSLTSEDGRTVELAREDAVPEEAECGTVSVLSGVAVEAEFETQANLVWDGVDLRFPEERAGVSALDVATGALSSPWAFGFENEVFPSTVQGGVPWNTCRCGQNQRIVHIQPGGVILDEVDTTALGRTISIHAAAVAEDGTLWLLGFGLGGASSWFLQVDTSGEPDVLLAEVETSAELSRMAAHRGAYYAIDREYLYRVVPSTGMVDRTWLIDGLTDDEWAAGIASDGATLWVAAATSGGPSRVVPVALE